MVALLEAVSPPCDKYDPCCHLALMKACLEVANIHVLSYKQ
jgi:hypothetical protein